MLKVPQVRGYRLGACLGVGGMGSVYEAVGSDGWEVALKIMQLPSRQHEMLRHRVRREAEVLLGLNHPRIVRAFDYIEETDRAILVLEKLKGESLRSHLIKRSLENQQLKASEVRSLLTGLVAAWEKCIEKVGSTGT